MSCMTSDSSQSGFASRQPKETSEQNTAQQRHPLGPRSFSAPRSATRQAMGHSGARAPAPPPLPLEVTSSSQDESSPIPSSASKWKRALKLKRPEEPSTSLSPSSPSKNKTLASSWKNRSKLTSESDVSLSDHGSTSGTSSSRVPISAKALATSTFDMLRGKKSPMSPTFSSPPPPPPKSPMTLEFSRKNLGLGHRKASPNGNSTTSLTPDISDSRTSERNVHSDPSKDSLKLQEEQIQVSKDDWRKSDATVKHVSSRTSSRPLSVAESSHSGHTVTPTPGGPMSAKRLSAMLTDADYATPEEDSMTGCSSLPVSAGPLSKAISSPSKSSHRRSLSMNVGNINYRNVLGISQSAKENVSTYSGTSGMTQSSLSLSNAKHPSTAPVGHYGMDHSRTPSRTTIESSTTDTSSGSSTKWSSTSALPPTGFRSADSHLTGRPKAPTKLRQTAISMGNGLAKLGRAIAHGNSTSAMPLNASHSANGTAPTSFFNVALRRTTSNQSDSAESGPEVRNKAKKRIKTPNAPSGTWSMVSSSGGQSDNEAALSNTSGAYLGVQVRGPFSLSATGYVFGRPLDESVKDTAVDSVRSRFNSPSSTGASESELLETRRLPALVFRCAQHILKWGIQEEGLFRVPGRQSHTSRLRSEFDSGADYDMSECGPGDLDPHAVGSLFKAFLRELPEPVLTRSLAPEFDAALSIELSAPPSPEIGKGLRGIGGPAMPANPRAGFQMALRKPPSLSTLSQPIFSTRSPSDVLVNTLSGLIARLPHENRDLLRTLTELIKATADNHKETKMPLGNLLLIFCPSLGMSPSLLKVLCEAEIEWNPPVAHADGTGSPAMEAEASGGKDEDEVVYDITSDRNGRDRTPVATMYLAEDSPRVSDPAQIIETDNNTHSLQIKASKSSLSPHVDDAKEGSNTSGSLVCTSPGASSSESSSLVTDHSVVEDTAAVHNIDPPPLKLDEDTLALRQLQEELIAASTGKSPRRYPSFTGPVQFPLISPSAPVTPTSPRSRLTLSTYSSSSPDLGPSLGQSLGRRMKKPSLQLLLHKRSITSLLSRPQSVAVSPTSTASSPLSPNVISVAPPVLDMELQYSPLKINIDSITDGDRDRDSQPNLNAFVERAYISVDTDALPTSSCPDSSKGIHSKRFAPPLSSPEMSHSSSNSSTYYTPMTRLAPSLLSTPSQTSQNSTGSYSLLDLELSKEDKDDWANSVLLAADAGLHS